MPESRDEWKTRMGIGRPASFAQLVGGDGTTRTTPILRDDAPGISGRRTEHWSGRVDASVTAPSITKNPNLKGRLHGNQE